MFSIIRKSTHSNTLMKFAVCSAVFLLSQSASYAQTSRVKYQVKVPDILKISIKSIVAGSSEISDGGTFPIATPIYDDTGAAFAKSEAEKFILQATTSSNRALEHSFFI